MEESMSKWQYLLSGLMIVGFFGVMALMMFAKVDVPEMFKEPLTLMVGALIGQFVQVINYVFGSSKGSSDKTRLLAQKTNGA
jgi:hypothetical protein